MPKGYPLLTPEQKQEIISRIKEKGERAADFRGTCHVRIKRKKK